VENAKIAKEMIVVNANFVKIKQSLGGQIEKSNAVN